MKQWLMVAEGGPAAYESPHHRVTRGWETSYCRSRDEHDVAEVAEGDGIALIRVGRYGGVVAHGRATSVIAEHHRDGGKRLGCQPREITVRFDKTYLSAPVPMRLLSDIGGLTKARYVRAARYMPAAPLEITVETWESLLRGTQAPGPYEWPMGWDLDAGTIVGRGDVHDVYGGQRQGSIGRSGTTPNTFLFLGAGSHGVPFTHRWADDGALVLVGKPEDIGRGEPPATPAGFENRLVLRHLRSGLPLRVFQSNGRKSVTYLGEVIIDQEHPVEGWIEAAAPPQPPSLPPPYTDPGNPPTARQFRAPLLRVHPVTSLTPFVSAEQQPRSQRQRLRLRVIRSASEPVSGPATRSVSDSELYRQAADRLREAPAGAAPELADVAEFAELVIRRGRAAGLAELRRLVLDPGTREPAIQRILEQHSWVFGGEFMGVAARRALSLSDQLDIPLIRGDGTLHGVEIKRACIAKLVVAHRGRAVVGEPVHEAVVQAMNYLRGLDEQRHTVLNEYGVDARRASMTVVIGAPAFVREQFTRQEIAEAIRTYNSHLSRVKVVTYPELLAAAERMLQLAAPPQARR
ncbi:MULTISPECIES: Shedu anti-phage system protein SduA domain-containing protein [unclassified Actinoplanes]|uniref:Shedu anti-phage system protein SduA domain-containing protein n=1 Tax=unclassified Actinoplanes TaxID=2626549 RepID=UPI0012FCFF9E|nr:MULTISPECIES: Shedu anti-phage system protein SduA domain-containing protein [unclassified Actinoplanes]